MNFTLKWYDVTENLASRKQPVVMIERPDAGNRRTGHGEIFTAGQAGRVGEFWVPATPLNQDEVRWGLTTTGELVRVPMHAYEVAVASKAMILAVGIELGVRAALAFSAKSVKSPAAVHLVLGTRVDLVDDRYQCYAGLAIQV